MVIDRRLSTELVVDRSLPDVYRLLSAELVVAKIFSTKVLSVDLVVAKVLFAGRVARFLSAERVVTKVFSVRLVVARVLFAGRVAKFLSAERVVTKVFSVGLVVAKVLSEDSDLVGAGQTRPKLPLAELVVGRPVPPIELRKFRIVWGVQAIPVYGRSSAEPGAVTGKSRGVCAQIGVRGGFP